MPFIPRITSGPRAGKPDDKYVPVPPQYDIHQSYKISCLNEGFSGMCQGLNFANGATVAWGLDAAYDEASEEGIERLRQLHWFWNADGYFKQVKNPLSGLMQHEWGAVYTIEPYVANPRAATEAEVTRLIEEADVPRRGSKPAVTDGPLTEATIIRR